MPTNPADTPLLPAAALRDICETLTGLAEPTDQLASRLQFVADSLADAGPLPATAILLWRQPDKPAIHHVAINQELVVGRKPGEPGLSLPEDNLLSRRHFLIRPENDHFVLEDLQSHNGTAINHSANRIQGHILHDGDLILAGNHIFVFLDHGQTV